MVADIAAPELFDPFVPVVESEEPPHAADDTSKVIDTSFARRIIVPP